MKVAFIGLGRMGSAMARNLLRAGHQLSVYNRTRSKADGLAAAGAYVAGSPAEAARDCELVVTMLADDAAVEESTWGDHGIAAALNPGAVHISCSTISTALARRLAAGHVSAGQQYVSAPVFGRPESAEAKQLLVVAAGPEESLNRCQPVFEVVGRQTFVAGKEQWQANAVKLCGNFMLGALIETFGEAFALLRKAGVAPSMFLDTMNELFASPVYANYGRIIAQQEFQPAGFALKLGLKDIRLALETALECAAPMPLASLLRDQFLSAIAAGQTDFDWSSVAQIAARNAGLD